MFSVSLTYRRPLEEIDRHLDEHITFLDTEYARGSFLASGRKVPRTGGVILSRLRDREELDADLDRDPFRVRGLAEYAVTEFVPTMVAEGLEALEEG
jgi:uncharacterized protein YciI